MSCPYCGEEIEIDLLGDASIVDWLPCCELAQLAAQDDGFEALTGETITETIERSTGCAARAVTTIDDSPEMLALFPLAGYAPGSGVKGWRAKVFSAIDAHHEHHSAPVSWKAGVAVYNGRLLVGVAVIGRPVARMLAQAQPNTLEVTRVCCFGLPVQRRNASSKLYSLAAKEARRIGADKLVTYTLESESGVSLRASGFVPVAVTRGGSWSRNDRPREDKAPTCRKVRWEKGLTKATRRQVESSAISLGA